MKKRVIFAATSLLFILGLFYILFLHHSEPTQASISLNYLNGELKLVPKAGWNISAPWVLVVKIDTRPMRVCVTSSGRGIDCKLIQFDSKAYQEFIEVEGFRYYWWANRLSFNFGYKEEYRGLRDILRGHAFGTKKYSFITKISEQ